MNETVTSSEYLPLPLRLLVLVLAIAVALIHMALVVYAAFKAWLKLPGPQAVLWTIACLFIPLPIIGPLVLLAMVNKHGKQPRVS
jgi:hypothetical protein